MDAINNLQQPLQSQGIKPQQGAKKPEDKSLQQAGGPANNPAQAIGGANNNLNGPNNDKAQIGPGFGMGAENAQGNDINNLFKKQANTLG